MTRATFRPALALGALLALSPAAPADPPRPPDPPRPLTPPKLPDDLGRLSATHESEDRGPGYYARDSNGKMAYGLYQLNAAFAWPASFVRKYYLNDFAVKDAQGNPVKDARGRTVLLEPGSTDFNRRWKEVAERDPDRMRAAQYQFVKQNFYEVQAAKLSRELKLDVDRRSAALRQVVWSVAVQHDNETRLIVDALKGWDLGRISDKDLIQAIYTERSRKFPTEAARYAREQAEALQMYEKGAANVTLKADRAADLLKPAVATRPPGGAGGNLPKPPERTTAAAPPPPPPGGGGAPAVKGVRMPTALDPNGVRRADGSPDLKQRVQDAPAVPAAKPAGKGWLEPPADAKELDAFAERCVRDGVPFKLSLKQVILAWAKTDAQGKVPPALAELYGFTWFFGVLVDRERNDVYLLGLKDPNRPPIRLDCLVTALRAAAAGESPFCSLDPDPDPKFQKTVVGGVPWETRWAEVMLEADYDMKKIALGDLRPGVAGLTPWFDLRLAAIKKAGLPDGEDRQANRWWFSRKDEPRTLVIDSDPGAPADLILLTKNPVVVLTEQEVDGKYGTGTVATEASAFAAALTAKLTAVGQKDKPIAELLALYRLLDLAVHLKAVAKAEPPLKDLWTESYRGGYKGPPKTFPTLRRTAALDAAGRARRVEYQAAGGVKMSLELDPKQFQTVRTDGRTKARLLAAP